MRAPRMLIAAAAALVCAVLPAPAQQIGTTGPSSKGPASRETIDKRLETRAAEIQKMAPRGANRFVLFDLAWPENEAEYRALGRHAVVVVVAVSQQAEELPLRRVFTAVGERKIALQKIWSARRETAEGSVTRTVFGPYREDAIYLVPSGSFMREYFLACDFAKNRDNFLINQNELEPPPFILDDRDRNNASKPAPAALTQFIVREFPGFGGR